MENQERNGIELSDYLDKQGTSQVSSWRWKKYWCVLKDKKLNFYQNKNDPLKKTIDVYDVDSVFKASANKKLCAFSIVMFDGTKQTFNCESQEKCSKWISCIQICINDSRAARSMLNPETSVENEVYVKVKDDILTENNSRLPTVYSEPWDSGASTSTFFVKVTESMNDKTLTLTPSKVPASPVWYATAKIPLEAVTSEKTSLNIARGNKNNDDSSYPASPVVMRQKSWLSNRSSVNSRDTLTNTDSCSLPTRNTLTSSEISPEISDASDTTDDDSDVTISDDDEGSETDTKSNSDFPDLTAEIPEIAHVGIEVTTPDIIELKEYLKNNIKNPMPIPRYKEDGFYVQQLKRYLQLLDLSSVPVM